MPLPDYYAVLMIHPGADQEIVDAAYRRLAAKYHPDLNPSRAAAERMRVINEAYGVLGDAEKRKAYDLLRANPVRDAPPPAPAADQRAVAVVCPNCRRAFERDLRPRDAYACPYCGQNYITLNGTVGSIRAMITRGVLTQRLVYRVGVNVPGNVQVVQFETAQDHPVQLRERDGVLFQFNPSRRLVLIQNLSLRLMWRL